MPLVQKTWAMKGLKSWQVTELDATSGYCIQCFMEWESAEAFAKAAAEDGPLIMGDVKNYTEGTAAIHVGKVVGSG